MTVINYFINDLINENEILPNTLLANHSTIVSEYLHHSVYNVHHKRWRHIVFGCRNKVDTEFLGKEEVQSLDIKRWWWVSFIHVYFSVKYFACFTAQILSEISQNDCVTTS